MGAKAFYHRSNSFPPTRSNSTIDEALSRGFNGGSQYSRKSLSEIEPPINDEVSSLRWKLESVEKELEDAQKEKVQKDDEIRSLGEQLKSVKKERDFLIAKAELRQILSNLFKSKGRLKKDLMRKARSMYPMEFPKNKYPSTFTATIEELLGGNEVGKDAKLNCLREAAKAFRDKSMPWWDKEIGEQFYILCINVSLWMDVDFHPEIKGERQEKCLKNAGNGLYKLDGDNVGPFVKEVLWGTYQ